MIPNQQTRAVAVVFARAPEMGKVKTRLQAAYSAEAVFLLYRAFLQDTLHLAKASGAKVILAHTPGPPFAEQQLADYCFEQRGASFGERMDGAIADARQNFPNAKLILIGSDSPHLSLESLRTAFELLSTKAVVLGPNPDDAFHLIGFQQKPVRLATAIGAPSEVTAIRNLCENEGLDVGLLAPQFDVDHPDNLGDLVALLKVLPPHARPVQTAARLRELGLL